MEYLSFRESDPRPKGPGPGFSDFIFSYCTISFWTCLIFSASLQAGRGELGRLRRSAVLVSSFFSSFSLELPVVQQMHRLPAELLGEELG
jgi:hypothetical protein